MFYIIVILSSRGLPASLVDPSGNGVSNGDFMTVNRQGIRAYFRDNNNNK